MITLKRTNSDNVDFQKMVQELDINLGIYYKEEKIFYGALNNIDNIKHTVVAYTKEGTPIGCGGIKEYSLSEVEIKRMYVQSTYRGKGIAKTILNALFYLYIDIKHNTMKILKQLLSYFMWVLLSFLTAFGYMRIILGSQPKPSKGLLKIFDWVYGVAMLYVGSILGFIIAFIYLIFDLFYLKKKLENNSKKTGIRFLIIIGIAILVGTTHYLLEKVIDVI